LFAVKAKTLDSGEPEFPEFQPVEDPGAENVRGLNLIEIDRYLNGPVGDQRSEPVAAESVVQVWLGMRAFADRWNLKPQLVDAKTAGQIMSELTPGGALMKQNDTKGDVRKYKLFNNFKLPTLTASN
jgi:hypothetical protein